MKIRRRYSAPVKCAAFLLALAGGLLMLLGLARADDFPEGLDTANYLDSEEYTSELVRAMNALEPLRSYESAQAIEQGRYFETERSGKIQQIQEDFQDKAREAWEAARQEALRWAAEGGLSDYYFPVEIPSELKGGQSSLEMESQQLEETQVQAEKEADAADGYAVYLRQIEEDCLLQLEEYSLQMQQELDSLRGETIESQLSVWEKAQWLIRSGEIRYVLEDAQGQLQSNMTDKSPKEQRDLLDRASGADYYYYSASGSYASPAPSQLPAEADGDQENLSLAAGNGLYGDGMYVEMGAQNFAARAAAYQSARSRGLWGLIFFCGGLATLVFCTLYLMISAGRRSTDEEIHLQAIDSLPPDVAVCIVGLLEVLAGMLLTMLLARNAGRLTDVRQYILGTILVLAMVSLLLVWLTSAARQLKAHCFWRSLLVVRIVLLLCRGIRNLLRGIFINTPRRIGRWFGRKMCGQRLSTRFVITGTAFALLCIFFSNMPILALFGVPALLIAMLFLHARIFKAHEQVEEGARRIGAGELGYRIDPAQAQGLENLAEHINNIAQGLSGAVESEVKAQRMKTDLISNVSHDIKTPLTSIITYIDLLKRQPLEGDTQEYVKILEQKARRLKTLTDDLFEAAKASSGTMPIELERVELSTLLRQGLGEMDDRIQQSGLVFRSELEEKYYVLADGRRLWRVIENLLSNVLKYALPHSRVYISAREEGEYIRLEIKNISANELNIEADELMERFVRGDASRHSEGSGLGLSIAKSLMELQGGHFNIEIDGDLFKAIVDIPRYPAPPQSEEQA